MKHPVAEIFSQGEEVINGHVADTNAAWLSQKLVEMGFVISRHSAVGDKLVDLVDLLIEISVRADFCICTGGLGPTIDDLTAEAVAKAFACPLKLDSVALKQIEQYFLGRNKVMAESNRKQAYFPEGAERLDNNWGTAPGFALQHNRCWFVFVPGVPTEMRHMFYEEVKHQLQQRFVLQADHLVVIKSIGIGESDLQQQLNEFSLPENVQLGFRATSDEVQTKLLFPANSEQSDIKTCVNQLLEKMGDKVFVTEYASDSSTNLVSVISELMNKKKWTVAIIETATQGLISAKCIGHDWLTESCYKPMNQLLKNDDILQTAVIMAKQLQQQSHTNLALVQLYQGDKNQFEDKEKGIVLYNVLITPSGIYQSTVTVVGPIKRKQNQAAIRALDLLRRVLQNCATNSIK